MIVSLFIVVPSRDAGLPLTVWSIVGLVVLGLVTGTVAGLIGVGGGIIVVPALMLIFGTSDLIAKGTSLLMMIPAAISGTVGNFRRGNVDSLAAALIGVAAMHHHRSRRVDRQTARPVLGRTSCSRSSSSSSPCRWRCARSAAAPLSRVGAVEAAR